MLTGPVASFESYGLLSRAHSQALRPTSASEAREALSAAAGAGQTVAMRGAGRSYGDLSLNDGGVALDCTLMNRVLAYDMEHGEITVEPGVTVAQLCKHVIADGWWPPVIPGTSAVTLGGALAADIHGKNNIPAGTLGDHVVRCTLALPSGDEITLTAGDGQDLSRYAIGSWGLLGCFTTITLRLRRIYSGLVEQHQHAYGSLDALLSGLDGLAATSDHVVGWVDTSAQGAGLGRGLLRTSRELLPGEDPDPRRSLSASYQSRTSLALRIAPAGMLPRLLRPLFKESAVGLINGLQWASGGRQSGRKGRLQPYMPANFLLDSIPHLNDVYRPGGMAQHQSFVPGPVAREVFGEILTRSRRAGHVAGVAVLKKHVASHFPLGYLRDGYSLALDYSVAPGAQADIIKLLRELNDLVIEAGGTFYLAKDSALTPEQFRRMYPAATLAAFAALKGQLDPRETLQSDLYRRVIRPALG
jgi:decaprenylphospho-beta-D-ribofuranose 2-oxidase